MMLSKSKTPASHATKSLISGCTLPGRASIGLSRLPFRVTVEFQIITHREKMGYMFFGYSWQDILVEGPNRIFDCLTLFQKRIYFIPYFSSSHFFWKNLE
jgi:hypothetical protein